MRKLMCAFGLVLLSTLPAFAADAAGTWKVDGDVVGNAVNFTCVLKQEKDALSGTATLGGQEVPVAGTVKEAVVSFEFDVDSHHLVFTGTLENGGIKGTIAVEGVEGTFAAARQ